MQTKSLTDNDSRIKKYFEMFDLTCVGTAQMPAEILSSFLEMPFEVYYSKIAKELGVLSVGSIGFIIKNPSRPNTQQIRGPLGGTVLNIRVGKYYDFSFYVHPQIGIDTAILDLYEKEMRLPIHGIPAVEDVLSNSSAFHAKAPYKYLLVPFLLNPIAKLGNKILLPLEKFEHILRDEEDDDGTMLPLHLTVEKLQKIEDILDKKVS